MTEYRTCYVCGCKMNHCVKNTKFKHKDRIIAINDVKSYKCECCGEEILELEEAKRIENIVLNKK